MSIKSYAGVGSRRTPEDVLDLMTRIAAYMRGRGWILRSGAADGAITAAACGPATGGTGTAIRIADAHTIRILNLRRPDHRARVERKIAGDESRPPGH